jgi:hypothetical protein
MSAIVEISSGIGGFAWWVFIRFGTTKLDDELKEGKRPRNLLCLMALFVLITFISTLL